MKERPRKMLSAYTWRGITPEGKKLSGEIAAPTLGRAQNSLIRHHIRILSIEKKKQPSRWFQHGLRPETRIIFFTQLAALLQAGLPLLNAIEIACQHKDDPALSQLFTTLRDEILAGKGLASGLAQFPHYFDHVTCHLVKAGEKSARLDSLMIRIAEHLQKMSELRRKIVRACFYPVITLVFATLVSVLLLAFMTPRFAVIFQEMHAPLPALTRGVLALGNSLHRILMPGIGLVGLLLCSVRFFRDAAWFRQGADWLGLHLPVTGEVVQKIILARVARTLSTLLSAGLPLTDVLGMTAPIAGNVYFTRAILRLQQAISMGNPLHQAMGESPLFPEALQQMVKAGEESATLEKMLEKTAEFHEAAVDHLTALISQLLEPLIMLILGVLIGALVIAMYLPIFRLGNAI